MREIEVQNRKFRFEIMATRRGGHALEPVRLLC
jgi:hypothetical protein